MAAEQGFHTAYSFLGSAAVLRRVRDSQGRRAHRDIVGVPAAADSAGHALQREASALQPCSCSVETLVF